MNEINQELARALSGLDASIKEQAYSDCGYHAEVRLARPETLRETARVLYRLEYFIGFVTACHTEPCIQGLYQFARYDVNHRIMVRCDADENKALPTISDIFQGADWHERETRDFFGITFEGHPNLEPLLLDPSDRDLTPLLKSEKKLKSIDDIFVPEVTDE